MDYLRAQGAFHPALRLVVYCWFHDVAAPAVQILDPDFQISGSEDT
jgi:hypothetical protein